jgi:hypothetical protein
MPLIPETLTAMLETDRAVALAAALTIGAHHADIIGWVWSTLEDEPAPEPRKRRKANRRGNGGARKDDRRLSRREHDDQALVEAMRDAPTASIGELVEAIGKSRTSTVSALHRLRVAGRAESIEGRWRLTEPLAPRGRRRNGSGRYRPLASSARMRDVSLDQAERWALSGRTEGIAEHVGAIHLHVLFGAQKEQLCHLGQ